MRLLKLSKLLNYHNPLILFWFPWFWSSSETAELRKVAARMTWNGHGWKWKGILVLKSLLWPLVITVALITTWLSQAKNAQTVGGLSPSKQLWQLLRFTYWYGFTPYDYYDVKIYEENVSSLMPYFLSERETMILALTMNGKSADVVGDKHLFDQACTEANLANVPALGAIHPKNYKSILSAETFPLPAKDLYLKPTCSSQGKGIERWDYYPDLEIWKSKATALNEHDLRAHFSKAAESASFILQEALYNHSDISLFSASGLVTFRVISIYDCKQEPSIIGAAMAAPCNSEATNHEYYGGLIATINMDSQCLNSGYTYVPTTIRHNAHPVTNAVIGGYEIKQLADIVALAKKAHVAFPDVYSIGWDIALTPDGPKILEGNTLWGLEVGLFLGKTPYVSQYLGLLKRRSAHDTSLSQYL